MLHFCRSRTANRIWRSTPDDATLARLSGLTRSDLWYDTAAHPVFNVEVTLAPGQAYTLIFCSSRIQSASGTKGVNMLEDPNAPCIRSCNPALPNTNLSHHMGQTSAPLTDRERGVFCDQTPGVDWQGVMTARRYGRGWGIETGEVG